MLLRIIFNRVRNKRFSDRTPAYTPLLRIRIASGSTYVTSKKRRDDDCSSSDKFREVQIRCTDFVKMQLKSDLPPPSYCDIKIELMLISCNARDNFNK